MCDAYGLRAPVHLIVETAGQADVELGIEGGAAPSLEARGLIRPTQTAPVIAPAPGGAGVGRGGAAVLVQWRWGSRPQASSDKGFSDLPKRSGDVPPSAA